MKIKISLFKQAGLLLMLSAAFAQVNAQQSIEAEAFVESAYVTVSDAPLFSGGHFVSMNAAYGSYVKYMITVQSAGTYDFAIDYATMNGRSMYIKVENYAPVIAIFDQFTASWDDGLEGVDEEGNPVPGIMTLTVPVYLNAGENEVEIGAFDGEDGSFSPNFDKFTVSPSETTIVPAILPATLTFEAEDARVTSAEVNTAECYSGGRGVFNIGASSKILFENINVAEEGVYDVTAYYTTYGERNFLVKSNNFLPVKMRCKIGLPYWTCPENEEQANDPARPSILKKTVQVWLNAGNNSIAFSSFQSEFCPNLDKIKVAKSSLILEKPGYEVMAAIFDFTDNVVNFATDFIEENATDSVNLSHLIDNNEYTAYVKDGVSSTKITAKTAYPIILTGYAIAGVSEQSNELLDDWVLEYSTDGVGWDVVANIGATDAGCYRSITTGYNLDNLVSAQYYRLTATGNGKVEIGEWQLFGVPYISAEQPFPSDDLTANVDFENILSYSMGEPDGFNRGSWNEVFENVFDKQLSTVYTVVDRKDFYIQFEMPDWVALKSYALTGRFGYARRSPSKWKIEAFNEAGHWLVLDARENIKFPADASTLMFNIEEPIETILYKLTVEDTGGDGTSNLVQWQMFSEWFGITPKTNRINNVTRDLPVTVASQKGAIQLYSTSATDLSFTVFDVLGKRIENGVCRQGLTEISAGSGVYIIRIGNTASKVLVK